MFLPDVRTTGEQSWIWYRPLKVKNCPLSEYIDDLAVEQFLTAPLSPWVEPRCIFYFKIIDSAKSIVNRKSVWTTNMQLRARRTVMCVRRRTNNFWPRYTTTFELIFRITDLYVSLTRCQDSVDTLFSYFCMLYTMVSNSPWSEHFWPSSREFEFEPANFCPKILNYSAPSVVHTAASLPRSIIFTKLYSGSKKPEVFSSLFERIAKSRFSSRSAFLACFCLMCGLQGSNPGSDTDLSKVKNCPLSEYIDDLAVEQFLTAPLSPWVEPRCIFYFKIIDSAKSIVNRKSVWTTNMQLRARRTVMCVRRRTNDFWPRYTTTFELIFRITDLYVSLTRCQDSVDTLFSYFCMLYTMVSNSPWSEHFWPSSREFEFEPANFCPKILNYSAPSVVHTAASLPRSIIFTKLYSGSKKPEVFSSLFERIAKSRFSSRSAFLACFCLMCGLQGSNPGSDTDLSKVKNCPLSEYIDDLAVEQFLTAPLSPWVEPRCIFYFKIIDSAKSIVNRKSVWTTNMQLRARRTVMCVRRRTNNFWPRYTTTFELIFRITDLYVSLTRCQDSVDTLFSYFCMLYTMVSNSPWSEHFWPSSREFEFEPANFCPKILNYSAPSVVHTAASLPRSIIFTKLYSGSKKPEVFSSLFERIAKSRFSSRSAFLACFCRMCGLQGAILDLIQTSLR